MISKRTQDMSSFIVMDVLEKDIAVEVPDPFVEPDGSMGLDELIAHWDRERKELCDLLNMTSFIDSCVTISSRSQSSLGSGTKRAL